MPVHCAYNDLADITTLIPNPRNPNQHPQKQIELLAKIIKSQGWRAPITVSTRSGFVVRGHGRLLAAQFLGVGQIPVDRQDYATEAEEWADLIADNRIA
ncbi:ParB/Srx family N-terminal domain-containing protein, partial [Pelosinus sp. Bkl1]|nr:ParB/Srx family N-terminal domain-containing protein [Pelosinus baikalensis]